MAQCLKCGGSGLLPFVKEGKVIPHTHLFCECRQENHEYLPALKPEDIDFACSRDWRSFYEEQATGRPLEPLEQASTLTSSPASQEPEWGKSQWQQVTQLRAMVRFLNAKVTEMRAEKKKGAETSPSEPGRIDITNKLYPNA